MSNPSILIIDDELQIRKLLQINLESNDYKIIQAENAKEGIHLAANHQPDLILLDIDLPDKNGHEVLKELRSWYQKSIIMLSVLNHENDIIKALDNGATDYLTKPFRTGELLARIRSAIRRNTIENDKSTFDFGEFQLDFVAHTLKKNNEVVKLTSTEYDLLTLFAKNEGKTLTHQYILKEIWGTAYQNETQYLRVFIAQIRKKIEANPNRPIHIITESGVGYRFN